MASVAPPAGDPLAERPGTAEHARPAAAGAGGADLASLATGLLAGGLILYLAVDGGGYDLLVRSRAAVVVWWMVLIGSAWGLLPRARSSAPARLAVVLFGAFAVWTALGVGWSLSSELSLQELSRVSFYFGVLLLAVSAHRDRAQALRHVTAGVATAIVIVTALALASRLHPGLFPAAAQTGRLLPGTRGRLGWPLNYWNALAALLAIGLPLLLAIATGARFLAVRAAAAAVVPAVALAGYLTFSRGGLIEAAGATLVFLLAGPGRPAKLGTVLLAAGGTTAVVLAASARAALERGLSGAAATHEGATLALILLLVMLAVAGAQAGLDLIARRLPAPRLPTVGRGAGMAVLAAVVAMAIVAAVALGAPARLSHAWTQFKRPPTASLHQSAIGRFGSISGNGRYAYWKVAVQAAGGHLLQGRGPGTYVLIWQHRAPYFSPIQNAHSLYLETLATQGVVGLALLLAVLGVLLVAAVRAVARAPRPESTYATGVTAALVAFVLAGAIDWVWQVPAIPVAALLLGAAVLAPEKISPRERRLISARHPGGRRAPASRAGGAAGRVGAIVLAAAALIATGIPMAAVSDVRASQAEAAAGALGPALTDARSALRVEPGSGSAAIQVALVLEAEHAFGAAVGAARHATAIDAHDWTSWLIRSRIEAEAGEGRQAVRDYARARSLNPHSPLFTELGAAAR